MADEETPESDAPESASTPSANVRDLSLEEEMKASYLTYAMSVIVARALPDVRDGLKPSQRRILVAANDLNLSPRSRFLKTRRVTTTPTARRSSTPRSCGSRRTS
jgi:DNA gyrase/topoisomerase IV subunit A